MLAGPAGLRTEETNDLAVPPSVAATLPRQAQELLAKGEF